MPSITDRLDNFPEPWKPEPGQKLIGELVDFNYRDSEYSDEPYAILTILDDHGAEWSWHAFHTMARSEVERRKPQIGERVGVAYHGPGTAAPGMHAPERWRVLVDRPTPPPTAEPPAGATPIEEPPGTGPQEHDDANADADGDDGIPF